MSRADTHRAPRRIASRNDRGADRQALLPPLLPELAVYLGLFALAAVSLLLAFWGALGGLAILACLAVAAIMASLVMVFFMHLRTAMTVIVLAGLSGVVWLVILFGLTLSDYLTRPGDFGTSVETPTATERMRSPPSER